MPLFILPRLQCTRIIKREPDTDQMEILQVKNKMLGKSILDSYTFQCVIEKHGLFQEQSFSNKDAPLIVARGQMNYSLNSNYLIKAASYTGLEDVVRLLLRDKHVDPSTDDNCAIQLASIRGQAAVVRLLLECNNVDPSVNNNLALRWAVDTNISDDTIKLLLGDHRVDPSVRQPPDSPFDLVWIAAARRNLTLRENMLLLSCV